MFSQMDVLLSATRCLRGRCAISSLDVRPAEAGVVVDKDSLAIRLEQEDIDEVDSFILYFSEDQSVVADLNEVDGAFTQSYNIATPTQSVAGSAGHKVLHEDRAVLPSDVYMSYPGRTRSMVTRPSFPRPRRWRQSCRLRFAFREYLFRAQFRGADADGVAYVFRHYHVCSSFSRCR